MSLPIEKATYFANAYAVTFGEAETGTKQVAISFQVVEHGELDGETIAWVGHFTDKTAARTIESLCHCGWQGEDLAEFEGMDEAAVRAALPETIELVCEPEEYNGELRLKPQWVNRRGGGRFAFKKPIAGNDLKAFAAQMRATVKGVRGGGARRAKQQSQHPNAPGGGIDDDIPFATSCMSQEPSGIAGILRANP